MFKILSVGGSIIIPKTGFDIKFLKKFRALILSRVKAGDKFVLVVGGGAVCRQYQTAAKIVAGLNNEALDWLGIYATHFNAEFVRLLFGKLAHGEVINNPTQKIKANKPIIVASGWKPGRSTDFDAVLLAKGCGAKTVVNLSNIDYVYDRDPRVNPGAKKFEKINWNDFRKIVGSKWSPGANVPFDPLAAKEAQKLGLSVFFAKGTDLKNLQRVLTNQKFKGTIVK